MTQEEEFKLTREEATALWNFLKHEHIPHSKEFEGLYDVVHKLSLYVYSVKEQK